jgi:hypothetical protein
MAGMQLLHEQREIEAGRATADTDYPHIESPFV